MVKEKNYLIHFGVKGMKWKNHTYKSIIGGEYIYTADEVTNRAAEMKKQGYTHDEIKTQIRSEMAERRAQAQANSSAGNYSGAAQRAEQRIATDRTQTAQKTGGYASEVANARAQAAENAKVKEKELAQKAVERNERLEKEKAEKKAQEEAQRKRIEEEAAKEEAEKAAKKAKKGSGKKGSSKKGSSSKKKTETKKTPEYHTIPGHYTIEVIDIEGNTRAKYSTSEESKHEEVYRFLQSIIDKNLEPERIAHEIEAAENCNAIQAIDSSIVVVGANIKLIQGLFINSTKTADDDEENYILCLKSLLS